MANYFLGLAERTLGLRETLQPSIASMFEPGMMLMEDCSEENSETIEQRVLPPSEQSSDAQFFFRSSPLKPNSEIEQRQEQQVAVGKPLPGFGVNLISGSPSLRLGGIVPTKSPTGGGLYAEESGIGMTGLGSSIKRLGIDEIENAETVLLGNVQGSLSRIDVADSGLLGGNLSIDNQPLPSQLSISGLVSLDSAIDLGQSGEANSQVYGKFDGQNLQTYGRFEELNSRLNSIANSRLDLQRCSGEWNSQLYKQSVPPHTNSKPIRDDRLRVFSSEAHLEEDRVGEDWFAVQSQLGFKETERDVQTSRSALTPSPSPKFGRGEQEFRFPFSQAWEKGLGDEGRIGKNEDEDSSLTMKPPYSPKTGEGSKSLVSLFLPLEKGLAQILQQSQQAIVPGSRALHSPAPDWKSGLIEPSPLKGTESTFQLLQSDETDFAPLAPNSTPERDSAEDEMPKIRLVGNGARFKLGNENYPQVEHHGIGQLIDRFQASSSTQQFDNHNRLLITDGLCTICSE
ncbi:hypothetical protein ACQ4M3_41650 [Leptolyngbya sp. AN03gr2]|uniref:hypothetical protein n=1 Tax=Leptolyngbya sp. AN03gr2 TaxID=3423364 RepID=UPI003D3198C9